MAQQYQARFDAGDSEAIPHTPSGADVAAGDVVVVGSRIGFSKLKIKDGELGNIHEGGKWHVVKEAGQAQNDGDPLYWKANGNPQGGVAGTGSATTDSEAGANKAIGHAIAAAGATDETVHMRHSPVPVPAG